MDKDLVFMLLFCLAIRLCVFGVGLLYVCVVYRMPAWFVVWVRGLSYECVVCRMPAFFVVRVRGLSYACVVYFIRDQTVAVLVLLLDLHCYTMGLMSSYSACFDVYIFFLWTVDLVPPGKLLEPPVHMAQRQMPIEMVSVAELVALLTLLSFWQYTMLLFTYMIFMAKEIILHIISNPLSLTQFDK